MISRHRSQTRRGFVLLLTLVTIALAGYLLTQIARLRLSAAVAFIESRDALQLRWGVLSVTRSLAYQPITGRHIDDEFHILDLGDLTFRVRMDNDSAKLNLNRLLVERGGEDLANLLRRQSGDFVALDPFQSTSPQQFFSSWGEVFALAQLPPDVDPLIWLAEHSRHFTCWGSGRLDYRATPDALLEELAPTVPLALIREFLDARRLNDELPLEELLGELDATPEELQKLSRWLTALPDCHTIWMMVDSPRANYRECCVVERKTFGRPQLTRFVW